MSATNGIRPIPSLALAGLGILAAISAGCGSGGASPKVQVANTAPKPANSVYRESAPQTRSAAMQTELNALRAQTYPGQLVDAQANNIPYTSAFRHAVYLNSLNSSGVNAASPSSSRGEVSVITGSSAYFTLQPESVIPGIGSQWPALFTNLALAERVEAVVGGKDLLYSASAGSDGVLSEAYVFDGDIYRADGTLGELRGYPMADSTIVENLWYQRRGRVPAMRASLRYFGYGQKDDTSGPFGSFTPPYPILSDRFLGVFNMVLAQPHVALEGVWPNNGNTNVRPYGLDSDLSGPNQYAGPPIHITIPVSEPFLRDIGVSEASLTKVAAQGSDTGVAITAGFSSSLRFFSNVNGLTVPSVSAPGGFTSVGPVAPTKTSIRVASATQLGDTQWRFTLQGLDLTGWSTTDRVTVKVEKRVDPTDPNVVTGTLVSCLVTEVDLAGGTITVQTGSVPSASIFFASINNLLRGPVGGGTAVGALVFINDGNLLIDWFQTGVSAVSAEVDKKMDLKNGEFFIVPDGQLEKNTWYRLQYQFKTTSYDSGFKKLWFKTNSKGR